MEDTFYVMFAILIGITGADLGLATQPQVVDNVIIVQTGTVARFNCTAAQGDPVHWATTPYGSKTQNDIYSGDLPLLDDYGRSGRFALVVNTTLRRYDLIINDTLLIDGGVFVCDDNGGYGNKTYTDLVVYEWNKKAVSECPGVGWTLNCSSHCTYELQLVNGTHTCCLMNFSTGADFYQKSSCVKVESCSEATGSSTDCAVPIVSGGILGIIIIVCLVAGVLIGFLCGRKYQSFRSWCIARRESEGRPGTDIEIHDVRGTPIDESNQAEAKPMISKVSSELTSEQGASAEERRE